MIAGYLAPGDDVSHEAFKSAAEALHDCYLFDVTNDAMLAKSEQINVPGIALYKNFEEGKDVFEERTHESQVITTFVEAAGTPFVVKFLPETHAKLVNVRLEKHGQAVPKTDYEILGWTSTWLHLHRIC